MSAHAGLYLLNELGKRSNARLAEHFIFFTTSLINSMIQSMNVRFYLSYDIKIN